MCHSRTLCHSRTIHWIILASRDNISVTTTALEAPFSLVSRHCCPSPTPSNAHLVFWIPLVILEHPELPGLKFSSNTEVNQGGHRKLPGPIPNAYTPPFCTNLQTSPFRMDSHLHSNSLAQSLLGLPFLSLFVPHDWPIPQDWFLLSPAPNSCIS